MDNLCSGRIKRILIARSAWAEIYEPSWRVALEHMGYECEVFETHQYIGDGILGRLQQRVLMGPKIDLVNRLLKEKVIEYRPDVCLFYQGHHYRPDTIKVISEISLTAGYHNDNPFSKRKVLFRYRHLLPALPFYDIYHVYRQSNVREFRLAGARRVEQLMSYYIPWKDFPLKQYDELAGSEWECDVAYAGHPEPDHRIECLEALISAGLKVKIYGDKDDWCKYLSRKSMGKIPPIKKVLGNDYRMAISGAKIALCFMSKWNEDQYTRRVFEIPACGVALFSEYTPQMSRLYKENDEVVFFADKIDLLKKIDKYLSVPEELRKVAIHGQRRANNSGYDIYSRMRQWIRDLESINNNTPVIGCEGF